MKVTISKNIDIEELPLEIIKMFEDSEVNMKNAINLRVIQMKKCLYSNSKDQFFHSLSVIAEYRKVLAEFDEKLQECQNIITGYKGVIEGQQPEAAPEAPEAPAAAQEVGEKLKDMVSKYEDLIENVDLEEEEIENPEFHKRQEVGELDE